MIVSLEVLGTNAYNRYAMQDEDYSPKNFNDISI